jgi:hypothetical protein
MISLTDRSAPKTMFNGVFGFIVMPIFPEWEKDAYSIWAAKQRLMPRENLYFLKYSGIKIAGLCKIHVNSTR